MTLTTHIRVVEPAHVKPIFDECRRLLNGQTDQRILVSETLALELDAAWDAYDDAVRDRLIVDD